MQPAAKASTPSGPVLPSNLKVVKTPSSLGPWRDGGGVASAIQIFGPTHEH